MLKIFILSISLEQSDALPLIPILCALQLLDFLLGHDDSALFRRAQLKALVSIHGKEVGLLIIVLYF